MELVTTNCRWRRLNVLMIEVDLNGPIISMDGVIRACSGLKGDFSRVNLLLIRRASRTPKDPTAWNMQTFLAVVNIFSLQSKLPIAIPCSQNDDMFEVCLSGERTHPEIREGMRISRQRLER